jgi:hypothetical protein
VLKRRRTGLLLAVGLAFAAAAAGLALRQFQAGSRDAAPGSELLSQLHALGYAEWAELAPDEAPRRGVVARAPERSHPGINLVLDFSRRGARLVDAQGRERHAWTGDAAGAGWHHAELAPDGTLLVIRRDGTLLALEPDSRVRFSRALGAHHDLALLDTGEIAVLRSAFIDVPYEGRSLPLVDDRVSVLSPAGELLREFSLYRLLGARIPAERLEHIAGHPREHWLERVQPPRRGVDVFHTNSVAWLPRDVPGLGRRGDFLLSVRELDLLAVIDPEGREVRWSWGPGELEAQHDASLLAGGSVLVFDNGKRRGFSRVLEIDPLARRIVWQHRAEPPAAFFSDRMGGCQALEGGNVLVTSSEQGRAFEVTRAGEVVWEYWSEEVDEGRRRRATLHRLTRYPEAFTAPLLEPAPAPQGGP